MRWQGYIFVCLMMAISLIVTADADLSVNNPWIRQAPPGITVMAGYMVVKNNTSRPQILVAASSSSFKSLSMHRNIVQNGMTAMEHVSQIKIAPNTSLEFTPGGNHLMLMNPQRTLHVGDRVDITLEFRGGLRLPVSYEIRR